MLIIKFDNKDVGEYSKQFYDTFTAIWHDASEATLDDYIDYFDTFLYARGFGPDAIEKYFTRIEEDIKDRVILDNEDTSS